MNHDPSVFSLQIQATLRCQTNQASGVENASDDCAVAFPIASQWSSGKNMPPISGDEPDHCAGLHRTDHSTEDTPVSAAARV